MKGPCWCQCGVKCRPWKSSTEEGSIILCRADGKKSFRVPVKSHPRPSHHLKHLAKRCLSCAQACGWPIAYCALARIFISAARGPCCNANYLYRCLLLSACPVARINRPNNMARRHQSKYLHWRGVSRPRQRRTQRKLIDCASSWNRKAISGAGHSALKISSMSACSKRGKKFNCVGIAAFFQQLR